MELLVSELETRAVYQLLSGCVVPRPIAWVTSVGPDGRVNAAPFSCYTFISSAPPLVAISCGRKAGISKDTAANANAMHEFVLNVVDEDLIVPMHKSSAEFPSSVSEIEALEISTLPSRMVAPPRISKAPVSLECRVQQILEFGRLRTQLLIGEVLVFHVRDDLYKNGKIATAEMRPLARLGGPFYARLGEIIRMDPVAEYHYSR